MGTAADQGARRSLAGDAGWSYAAALATLLAGLGSLALAAHSVGARSLAAFVLLDAVVAVVQAAAFGLSVTALHVDTDVESVAERLRTLKALRSLALAIAVLVAVVPLVVASIPGFGVAQGRHDLTALAALLGVAGAIAVASSVDQGLATARSQYKAMAVLEVLGALTSIVIVLSTLEPWGLLGLAVARLVNLMLSRGGLVVLTARTRGRDALGFATPTSPDLARVRLQSAPLFIVTVGVQVVLLTDTVVLQAVVGPVAVTTYRLAGSVPTQVASWVFRGYDVLLPRLAGRVPVDPARLQLLVRSSRLFCAGSAAVLTAAAVVSPGVMQLVSGQRLPHAAITMAVFCLLWAINVVVHGPVLLLMASGQQSVLTRIVAAEVLANVVLTVVLAETSGLRGVVVASLVAVMLSNLVLLPPAMARRLGVSVRQLFSPGIGASLGGAAIGALVSAPLLLIPGVR